MESIIDIVRPAEMRRRTRLRDEYSRRIGPLPEWAFEADAAEWPTLGTVRDLQAAFRGAEASQALGLRHLLRFAIGEYLLRQTQIPSANLLEQQRSSLVQ